MQAVSAAAVQDAWHDLYNSSDDHAESLVDAFIHEQPHLADLLARAESSISTVDDRGFLLLYGTWAWLAFRRAGRSNHPIPASAVAAALARNQLDAAWLQNSSDKSLLDSARHFTRDYRQWPLFSALIHDIMQGELEREQSADDITGILLLHAKTIVDALDA